MVHAGWRRQLPALLAARLDFQILELGSVSYLALVNAEQTYQQAVVSLVQARGNRYADSAAVSGVGRRHRAGCHCCNNSLGVSLNRQRS
jgi:hypothetical protein